MHGGVRSGCKKICVDKTVCVDKTQVNGSKHFFLMSIVEIFFWVNHIFEAHATITWCRYRFLPAHSAGTGKWKNPSSRTQGSMPGGSEECPAKSAESNYHHIKLVDILCFNCFNQLAASCEVSVAWFFCSVSLLYEWCLFISLVTPSWTTPNSKIPIHPLIGLLRDSCNDFGCKSFPRSFPMTSMTCRWCLGVWSRFLGPFYVFSI